LLAYLGAGVFVEAMIVSSSRWVIINDYKGYYLSDLTFLVLLAGILAARLLAQRVIQPHLYPKFLSIIVIGALLLNAREWNSFTPTLPFMAMDKSIGASTPSIIAAGCDLLIGDYWKAWPPMLATNDYYYRNHVIDPRTGETRMVVTISNRARPIEYMWQPRLDWPDVNVCGLTGDKWGMQSGLQYYAPDIMLFLVEPQQFGEITVYHIGNPRLPRLSLNFDSPTPGDGWALERTLNDGPTFQWMAATASTLYLPLAIDHSLHIEFRVIFAMAPDILQSLTLYVNNQPIQLNSTSDGGGGKLFQGIIPESTLAANTRSTVLTFHINRTLVPELVIPGSSDSRSLGLAFDWLNIK
jgi:hypothetical protein